MDFKFLKTYQGHNSKSYGPFAPIPVYTIHPVIVHVYTNFLAFLRSKKYVTNVFKNGKFENLPRDITP